MLKSWLASPRRHTVSLSLPLRRTPREGVPVLNFFQNLLPDSPRVLERVQRRLGIEGLHPLSLLSAIGRDCVGAFQFLPEGESPGDEEPGGDILSEKEIEELLGSLALRPLGMDRDGSFRISIAGAQEKTALLRRGGHWMRPRGATPTTHIFKIPIGVISANGMDLSSSCENEWLCLKIARAYGFQAANAEILAFGSRKALAVERFDRRETADGRILRLPAEDMCQALGVSPLLKYESDGGPGIADIARALKFSRSRGDPLEFLRAQALFWMLGAIDGHAKNFSIFHVPGGFRLAPLYDILSAWPLAAANAQDASKLRLAMALPGGDRLSRISEIRKPHFLAAARACGIPESAMLRELDRMAGMTGAVIERTASDLPAGFPKAVSEPIFGGLRRQAKALLCG